MKQLHQAPVLGTAADLRLCLVRRSLHEQFVGSNGCALQVSLLNSEQNSQLMLLAARNLTLLADVLPAICSSIVRNGAVPALCARLMTIEYIDLAEQSLQVRLLLSSHQSENISTQTHAGHA